MSTLVKRKVMLIGIMSLEQQRARTIAIARGEYKPKRDEPKVWFPSMASVSQILSDENQNLIYTIAQYHPESMNELAEITGRAKSNLSRTLKKLEAYGLVQLKEGKGNKKIPEALATAFDIKAGDWGFKHTQQQAQAC